MSNSERDYNLRTLRFERIRAKRTDLGLGTDTQLYDHIREKAAELAYSGIPGKHATADADAISSWSDDQFRQTMAVRGGTRYRALIELVCEVFADLTTLPSDRNERLRALRTHILDLAPEVSLGTSPEYDPFPLVQMYISEHSEGNADEFFNAVPVGLSAISESLDIDRDQYSALLHSVDEALEGAGSHPILLTGVAGAGKTVLLDRLAHDKIASGVSVFRCASALVDRQTLIQAVRQVRLRATCPILFVFDNSNFLFEREVTIKEIEALATEEHRFNAAIVLSENWMVRRESATFLDYQQRGRPGHIVSELSQREVMDLVDRIEKYEKSGGIKEIRCTLPKESRLKLLVTRSDRLAIVALLKLRYGKNVDEILHDEYESISSEEVRGVYRDTIILSSIRLSYPEAILHRNLGSALSNPDTTAALRSLLRLEEDGFHPRHPALTRTLLTAIFPDRAARALALFGFLMSLNLNERVDREHFFSFAARPSAARAIFGLFDGNTEVMRSLLADLEGRESFFASHQMLVPLFGLIGSLHKDVLGDLVVAAGWFERAYALDQYNPYVLRQMGWTCLKLGRLKEAESYARESTEKWIDDGRTLSDAAFILSWCSRQGFRDAGALYQRAVELDSSDPALLRRVERYQDAKAIFEVMSSEEIPDLVLEELGAPSFIWRVRRHARRQYKSAVLRELSRNLQRENQDLDEINEAIEAAGTVGDARLSGLLKANIARAEYERWYKSSAPIDRDEVRSMFRLASERCPDDPFVHCWFGTFLKEVDDDYSGAMAEYERALAASRSSKNDNFVDHPMIHNNIALLIVDGVYKRTVAPTELVRAQLSLEIAIKRMGSHVPDFTWPLATMESLRRLASDFGVKLPEPHEARMETR
jgi:tetratricopeptide (TPR) repeat protein